MTEFNFSELIQGALNNGMTSFTIWITIVSGYLFVAYIAGKNLNGIQVTIINGLYLLSSAIFTAITFTFLSRAVRTIQIKEELFTAPLLPVQNVNEAFAFAVALAILMVCGIAASLYFMWDIRRKVNYHDAAN